MVDGMRLGGSPDLDRMAGSLGVVIYPFPTKVPTASLRVGYSSALEARQRRVCHPLRPPQAAPPSNGKSTSNAMNRRAALMRSLRLPHAGQAGAVEPQKQVALLLRASPCLRSQLQGAHRREARPSIVFQEDNDLSLAAQTDLNNVPKICQPRSPSVACRCRSPPPYSKARWRWGPHLVRASRHAVCLPGLADAIPQISAVCRRRGVLSVTTSNAYIKSGLSVGLSPGKTAFASPINLPASKAEGVDLDAALLRIAEVYR